MSWKTVFKKSLQRVGLLKFSQEINYQLSFYNKNDPHPRKLVFLFYRQFINKGDLVFDIGANIGERVSIFKELGAAIVAVEPQVHCVNKIKKKFGDDKKVHIENCGLGEQKGQMDFYICEEDDRLSTFSTDQIEKSFFTGNTKWDRREVVQILTLDDLIEKYGMAKFCKIDVEGFELNVLMGLTKVVPVLSFEFSSKQIDKIRQCISQLHRISSKYKFNLCFGEPYHLHFNNWVDGEEILKAVKEADKHSATHAWGDIYAKSL